MTVPYPSPELVMRAITKGFRLRPQGYQNVNDGWLCGHCGYIEVISDQVLKPHKLCKGGFCLAIITESHWQQWRNRP
jgi:hypothetical protein